MIPEAGISFYDGTQGPKGGSTFSGAHADLTGLDYASAGHTGFAPSTHSHSISDVTNLTTTLSGKVDSSVVLNVTAPITGGGALTTSRTFGFDTSYIREKLTTSRTYYVRTDGNDANTGLVDSSAGAFLTLQQAANVYGRLDCSGYDVTIQLGAGTYTGAMAIAQRIGAGSLYIVGNEVTPANVLISVTNSNALSFIGHPPGSYVFVRGVKISVSGAGNGIDVEGGSNVICRNIAFGAVAWYMLYSANGGTIWLDTAVTVAGNAQVCFSATQNGIIKTSAATTVTMSGTPAFSTADAYAFLLGILDFTNVSFSGSATGKRYSAILNSVINSGGNTIPGNVSGSTSSGGQYL